MPSPADPRRIATPVRAPWLPWVLLLCGALALAGGLAHRPGLSVAAAVLLLLAWLPQIWRSHSAVAAAVWVGLAGLLLVPAAAGHAALALMALPVVFLGGVSWVFGRTLKRGAEPLVSRFVRVIEGEARLNLPGVRAYTRGVTIFWTVVLGAMALLSLALALFAEPGGWFATFRWPVPLAVPGSILAWYPEVGCWSVLLLAFVGEYLFRRWYLRAIPHPTVGRFVTQIVRRWPALIRGGDGAA